MRIWHFKLRNIRRYAAYLGHCLQLCSFDLELPTQIRFTLEIFIIGIPTIQHRRY